jgi:hypothetical protein
MEVEFEFNFVVHIGNDYSPVAGFEYASHAITFAIAQSKAWQSNYYTVKDHNSGEFVTIRAGHITAFTTIGNSVFDDARIRIMEMGAL